MAKHTKHGDPVIYVHSARYNRVKFGRYDNKPDWMVQAERFIRDNNTATWPILNPILRGKDQCI